MTDTDAVTLRKLAPEDESAWFALYSAVRAEELLMDGWDAALRDLVLRQQFDAQRRGNRTRYPASREHLILVGDRPVGWVVLDRTVPTWRCVDIAIAAEHRRQGIARGVLRAFQDEAGAAHCAVSLMVLRSNASARALYDDLGFRITGGTETHWLMEWRE